MAKHTFTATAIRPGPVLQPNTHLQPRPFPGEQEAPGGISEAVASHTEGGLALFIQGAQLRSQLPLSICWGSVERQTVPALIAAKHG